MSTLPSEIIFNILTRTPLKSLARLRCVSKLWRECIDDQYLKIIHDQRSPQEALIMIATTHLEHPSTSFYAIEPQRPTARVLKAKTIPSLKFKCTNYSADNIPFVQGSCNGLVYLSRDWTMHPSDFIVVNPLRKEYYQLPPLDLRFDRSNYVVHGLGFDDSTNTFKMVFFVEPESEPFDLCTMVHVFGTNSWREISRVPLSPMMTIEGGFNIAVFARGCLHWLAGHGARVDDESGIICLDMRTEEFGLIDLPRRQGSGERYGRLVDLNDEVGYVESYKYIGLEVVWVLKQKEWVSYCRFVRKPPLPRSMRVTVLGRWNEDGDIFLKTGPLGAEQRLFVYCRKSGVLKEVKLSSNPNDISMKDTFIYRSSMFSIHGIKAYSVKS